ncbi:hypothetical protein CERZMDRAFT_45816 [Cercospora zeae-maydis SCOH1-5]|uniref:AB hydrolase-1 domain-containing protein n=1 Tax=Cercospora zeae-maydis SCOH1-5 TaxID=717836 RepID=A0A6A6FA27_9PEZI|nr:hypothetical protein CERZMDRAFT_45816 [Cercospora zeae-maydis SCOH1-5]
MSSFEIVEHKIPCQHIREYPRALSGPQEGVLHLTVKQYIPKDNTDPQPGDVTIIGAHANAFPKELYEPLWDDIHANSKQHGFRIRSIWVADVANQGYSGVHNEKLLGNDPNWNDHARDLLHMINVKRDLMPRPLIGIGHSMGATHIVNLSYIHPRLLTTVILIDPALRSTNSLPGPNPARSSTFRRDVWPSRQEAANAFRASKFYQAWDTRVLDRWVQHGLRDMPTLLHQQGAPNVTLTTPVSQEVFTFLRPNYEGYGWQGVPINRDTHADLNPSIPHTFPFYRPELPQAFLRLPELRPSVLYIFGGASELSTTEVIESLMASTGIGTGGSGGVAAGRVQQIVLQDVGHLIPMEDVLRTADHSSEWLASQLALWRKHEAEFERLWNAKSLTSKQTVDEQWKKMVGGPPRKPEKAKI